MPGPHEKAWQDSPAFYSGSISEEIRPKQTETDSEVTEPSAIENTAESAESAAKAVPVEAQISSVDEKINEEGNRYNAAREALGLQAESNPTTIAIDSFNNKKTAILKQKENPDPISTGAEKVLAPSKKEINREQELEALQDHIKRFDGSLAALRDAARRDKDGLLGERFFAKTNKAVNDIERVGSRISQDQFKTMENVASLVAEAVSALGVGNRPMPDKESLKNISSARIAFENLKMETTRLAIFANEGNDPDLKGQYTVMKGMEAKCDKALDFLDRLYTAVRRVTG